MFPARLTLARLFPHRRSLPVLPVGEGAAEQITSFSALYFMCFRV